jgi:hypothetical protein
MQRVAETRVALQEFSLDDGLYLLATEGSSGDGLLGLGRKGIVRCPLIPFTGTSCMCNIPLWMNFSRFPRAGDS